MPDLQVRGTKFLEAIEFFNKKLQLPTESWDQFLGETHAKAFTIAGATKTDLLNDFHQAVGAAINNGESIGQFRKRFDEIVAKHGWSYKGERGWRTRVIYDNNLHSAHAAGRWAQFQRLKTKRPFLGYFTVADERVRPQHRKWHGIILPIDDPWWDTHYPPNGWGCRCYVRSYSQRELDRLGLKVSKAPQIVTSERINPTTGVVYGEVPVGIDVGWDYNVGKAWLGPDIKFGQQIMSLPKDLRDQALRSTELLTTHIQRYFAPWVEKFIDPEANFARGEIRTIGYLTPFLIDSLATRGITPSTAVISITDHELKHLRRDDKQNSKTKSSDDKHLPPEMVRLIPSLIANPQAVLWDKQDAAVLYVFNIQGIAMDDRAGKLVLRIEFSTKGRGQDYNRHKFITNSIRTGGVVETRNLQDSAKYELIDGKL